MKLTFSKKTGTFLFIILMLLAAGVHAQRSLKSAIRDERSGTTLPFVTLEEGSQPLFDLRSLGKTLGLDAQSQLVLMQKETDELSITTYRFSQAYKGIPVENAMYVVQTKNGKIIGLSGTIILDFSKGEQQKATANISAQAALQSALKVINAKEYMWESAGMEKRIKNEQSDKQATYKPNPTLVWCSNDGQVNPRSLRLAYKMDVYAKEPLSRADYFVDAADGKVLSSADKIHTTAAYGTAATAYSGSQNIYSDNTAASSYRLRDYTKGSGIITLHGESGLSGTDYVNTTANWTLAGVNQAALDAHYGASQTYQFYQFVLGRNSYNNTGGALYSYVNEAGNDNAFWDGSAMHYLKRSTGAAGGVTGIDVTGHELTHGVTGATSKLNYSKEPGAINESMSDIMGKAVQFWSKPADINWQLSNDMGWIIRDMSNPNLKAQPDTYLGTYWQASTNTNDNYGVHTNSGVGNFMFYLLSTGGSGTNDFGNAFSVTGIGMLKAEKIIYRTNAVYLTPTSGYSGWRVACINAATDLFGGASNEVLQVKNAWYAVGIGSAGGGNTYCPSKGNNSTYEFINNVSLNTLNYTSGNNGGYANFAALSTTLAANNATSYAITLTPGFSLGAYTEYWSVYIDYNQNGSLSDSGELVAKGSGTSAVTLYFKVPFTALNGKTMMRVQMNYGSQSTDPCATLTYGEVEDYPLFITNGITYCASAGNTFYEYINQVQLGAISNTSGNNFGYGNFSNLTTTIWKTFSNTISLTPGYSGGAFPEYWKVYIDYNRNGLFTDAGEEVATGSGTGAISASFTVPLSIFSGNARMRVQMQYGATPGSPCTTGYGEVEDYTVNLVSPYIICTGCTFPATAKNNADAATAKKTGQINENQNAYVAIAPNPATGPNIKVLYITAADGPVTLKLADLNGRIIQQTSIGAKVKGSYNFTLVLTGKVASGSYIIMLEQNGKIAARNICLLIE